MRVALACFALALLSGCAGLLGDSGNSVAYRISAVKTPQDNEIVKAVLQSVAAKAGLVAAPWPHYIPRGLVLYRSPPGDDFGTYLGAQADHGSIIVILDGQFGPPIRRWNHTERLLVPALKQHFGSRLTLTKWDETLAYRRVNG